MLTKFEYVAYRLMLMKDSTENDLEQHSYVDKSTQYWSSIQKEIIEISS